ncbi:MAG: T9SS type A sorting domain-containing protein [Bacteroidota bacterium]
MTAFLTLIFLSGTLFGQVDILVIDFNNAFNSDRSMNNSRVYNRLVATQGTVNRVNSVPGSISNVTYDQVWIYGNPGGASAGTLNPIINFINGGGAVYMQSEVTCCNNMGAYVEDVMQAAVAGGGSMTHNPPISGFYRWSTSAAASCPGITDFGAAARIFQGVPAQNHLFVAMNGCGTTITPPDVMGVMFRSCDMSGNQGALVASGDFNMWIASSTCGSVGIIGTPNRNDMIDLTVALLSDLTQCGTCGIVLPVEIADFQVEAVQDAVQLDWATVRESHNAYFSIERSADAGQFHEIDRIEGAGDSDVRLDYQYIDRSPLSGTSYYRLKQTDLNGETSYTEIKSVYFGGWGAMSVYQRDRDRNLVVESLPEDVVRVELLSISGQILRTTAEINTGKAMLETQGLADGMYLVRAITRLGRPIVKKVLVNE